MVKISTSFGSGGTIGTLSKILQQRMQYMRETARDSIAATAIDVLRSLRTATKVAKPSTIKVQVERDAHLFPSFTSRGGGKRPCLRIVGTNARYEGTEKMLMGEKMPVKVQHVYRFTDTFSRKKTTYLIVAPSMGVAKKRAQAIARKRGMRYAGLAKRALGILMFKTNTKRVNDGTLNPLVEVKAEEITDKNETVRKVGEGGTYTLTLTDNLKYALDAIKGGRSNVEVAFKKAANKVASIINRRISKGNFLDAQKLPTPFPEVRQRR